MMSDPQPGEFGWNELLTTDVPKAKAFYEALFAWEAHEVDMGDNSYTLFKSGETEIAGMMECPAEMGTPSHWMSYIAVKNIEMMLTKAQALGGRVVSPVTEIKDYGRFAIIVDPTGARFAFWQSIKSE